MKVLSIVGVRPQFVKLAPIDLALRQRGHEHVIVHSGQHYDRPMSQAFFDDLSIAPPVTNLGLGSGSHAHQTAGILAALDPVFEEHRPDWTLLYGDTNTTLAGALAAAQHQLPLAHLEAGLRSFDRVMPEERNRVVADHLSDLLLAPTAVAVQNLTNEGQPRAVLVGDVMVDTLAAMRARVAVAPERYLPTYSRHAPYLLATVHRQETTDDPVRLAATLRALARCPLPVRLLAHPRLRNRADKLGIPLTSGVLQASEPLPYPNMVAATTAARGLITYSGGLLEGGPASRGATYNAAVADRVARDAAGRLERSRERPAGSGFRRVTAPAAGSSAKALRRRLGSGARRRGTRLKATEGRILSRFRSHGALLNALRGGEECSRPTEDSAGRQSARLAQPNRQCEQNLQADAVCGSFRALL